MLGVINKSSLPNIITTAQSAISIYNKYIILLRGGRRHWTDNFTLNQSCIDMIYHWSTNKHWVVFISLSGLTNIWCQTIFSKFYFWNLKLINQLIIQCYPLKTLSSPLNFIWSFCEYETRYAEVNTHHKFYILRTNFEGVIFLRGKSWYIYNFNIIPRTGGLKII